MMSRVPPSTTPATGSSRRACSRDSFPATDITLAAYNVFRAPGNYASGDPAGRENIANAYLGLGLHMLGTVVEPSIEGRHWLQNIPGRRTPTDHSQSSYLATVGLRTRIGAGGLPKGGGESSRGGQPPP